MIGLEEVKYRHEDRGRAADHEQNGEYVSP
jgi:hypothetical protein